MAPCSLVVMKVGGLALTGATRGQQPGPNEETFLASVRRDLGQGEEKRKGRELEDPVQFFYSSGFMCF